MDWTGTWHVVSSLGFDDDYLWVRQENDTDYNTDARMGVYQGEQVLRLTAPIRANRYRAGADTDRIVRVERSLCLDGTYPCHPCESVSYRCVNRSDRPSGTIPMS